MLADKDPSLSGRLPEIERLAMSVLTYTAGGFPYFTSHDYAHSVQVEENLNWLIPDEVKLDLSGHEIFFLLVAAWLHDWGMVSRPEERQDDVRRCHHIRTEDNFNKMYHLVKLDFHEARIIGRIARGHRVEDLRSALFDRQIYSADVHVDVRFLAAILRLADECDITHNRVPELIYYSLSPRDSSEEHFRKHLNIQGIGQWVPYKIEFFAVATDPKGSQTLRKLCEKIQREVDQVKGILAQRRIPIEYVEVHIDARGFIDKPIAIRLDEARVTQLLIGEHLYSRKDVAVRELLQNSVDACRAGASHSPQIRIYLEGDKLVIQDNGIGIDFETAYKFLAQKGFSYYQSDEFKENVRASSFDPISRWGLGILSCFLVASAISIETKKQGSDSCKFLIPNVSEGWRCEEGALSEPGTIVVLTLNETGKSIDLEKSLHHYVKNCPVPIYVGKESTSPLKLDWSVDDPDVQEAISDRYGPRRMKMEWDKKFEDDDLSVRYYRSDSTSGLVFVADQGFFVGEFREVDALFPRHITGIALISSKKSLFDLDISREKIRTNTEKYRSFRDKWTQVCIGLMKEELEQHRAEASAKDDLSEVMEYQRLLGIYDLSIIGGSRLVEKADLEAIPKAFKDFLMTEVPFIVLTRNGLRKMHLADLSLSGPEKIILYFLATDNYEGVLPEVDLLKSEHAEKLADRDAVILMPRWFGPEQDVRMILGFFLGKIEQLAYLDMCDVVRGLRLEEVKTPLDSYLPPNSHFSRLPPQLRGAVIFMEPFQVKTSARPVDMSIALALVSPPVDAFTEDMGTESREALPGCLSHVLLGREIRNFELVAHGHSTFDCEDEFTQMLIRNLERVNESDLRDAVKNYFMQLLTYFIVPSSITEDHLNIKESEICARLKQPKPRLIEERRGRASRALLDLQIMIFVPFRRPEYFAVNVTKRTKHEDNG